jgi:hypothetical protein
MLIMILMMTVFMMIKIVMTHLFHSFDIVFLSYDDNNDSSSMCR